MVGAAGFPCHIGIKTGIDDKCTSGTYCSVIHIYGTSRIGQGAVSGKVQIKIEPKTNFLQVRISIGGVLVAGQQ
jgi:hypothetical protein